MARQTAQLVLDDDAFVELAVNIPLPLYRALHAYCVFRNAAGERLQAVMRGAIRSYLADNEAFQAWLREHPDLPTPPPEDAPRRRRSGAKTHAHRSDSTARRTRNAPGSVSE
jgi:hypothetical protein